LLKGNRASGLSPALSAEHGMNATDVMRRADALVDDPHLAALSEFKKKGGHVVGIAPAYVPTELPDAAGALPAHLWGAGGNVEVVQGDAYFQSSICHLPRGLIELKLRGALDCLDLFVAPSTCDVMRNLTGIWQVAFPKDAVHYLDLPQRDDEMASWFYKRELGHLLARIEKAVGKKITNDDLNAAIGRENERRKVLNQLDAMRTKEPWRVPASEFVTLVRAGSQLTPVEHTAMLRDYYESRKAEKRAPSASGAPWNAPAARSSPTTCTWACAGSPRPCPPPVTRWRTSRWPT
jgi:benzoyl-CoA reductase subunit C